MMRWLVLIAAACLPQTLPAEPGSEFFGVWTGTVTEVVEAGKRYSNYDVSLSLVPGEYRVDYPTLGCGARLRFTERHGRWMRFQDELIYGLEACVNGRTAFRLDGQDQGVYMWFDAGGRLKAEGVLRRRKQVMAALSQ